MLVFPHAKINLGLQVIRKREDGFHELETVFYPVNWSDILEVNTIKTGSRITLSGLQLDGRPEDNLCMKAYKLLAADFGLPPLEFHLHKLVPAGAGLGGGSSDAAFALKLINEYCHLSLREEQLEKYAAMLGSDCAFFIRGTPALAKGRGEILEPVDLSLEAYYLLLVVPPVHVSTREAYAGVKPSKPLSGLRELISKPVEEWRQVLKNDFEESVFKKHTILRDLKNFLYQEGAIYASMSGSGSALYALFREPCKLRHELDDCLIFRSWEQKQY